MVRYTFGADECLAPREPVPGVITLTSLHSLRQPLERAASHFYHDMEGGALEGESWSRKRTAGNCTSFDCFVLERMELGDYQKYHWHNYMTRFFSGTAHADPIGEEELERAKARLEGVDFLIDLANFEACMEPLRERLHWNQTGLDQVRSSLMDMPRRLNDYQRSRASASNRGEKDSVQGDPGDTIGRNMMH